MDLPSDPGSYWAAIGAIAQIAAAIATFAAVAVSLWIALSERSEKLKLKADLWVIMGGEADPLDVIGFEVTNVGTRPVRVMGFGWRSGWSRFGPSWLTIRNAVQMPSDLPFSFAAPFTLEPGHKASVLNRADTYVPHNENSAEFFGYRRIPLLGLKFPKVTGYVYTARGTTVDVKIGKSAYDRLKAAFLPIDAP